MLFDIWRLLKTHSLSLSSWTSISSYTWCTLSTNELQVNSLTTEKKINSTSYCQRIPLYFGHIARRQYDNFHKMWVMGEAKGRRPKGRWLPKLLNGLLDSPTHIKAFCGLNDMEICPSSSTRTCQSKHDPQQWIKQWKEKIFKYLLLLKFSNIYDYDKFCWYILSNLFSCTLVGNY